MTKIPVNSLNDLNNLNSSPELDTEKYKSFMKELTSYINDSDWFTVGIMAANYKEAIITIRQIEAYFNWPKMNVLSCPQQEGPVFLKANQSTNSVHIRIEHGLGKGILISCQHYDEKKHTNTYGPLPLDFFSPENQ